MEIVEEGAEDLAAGAAGADPVLALTAEVAVVGLEGVIVVAVILEEVAAEEATAAEASAAAAVAAAVLTNQERV